jgi:PAS domain-containing protein
MTDATSSRPKTLEEALRALDEVEAKLRAHDDHETAVNRLTERARISEERFRTLAEGVPNHLLFLDRELRILFANDVFLEATGWSTDKAAGTHISDVMGVERFLERQPYY